MQSLNYVISWIIQAKNERRTSNKKHLIKASQQMTQNPYIEYVIDKYFAEEDKD